MKCLYVSLVGRSSSLGIVKKTISKITLLRNHLTISGILIFRELNTQHDAPDFIQLMCIKGDYYPGLLELVNNDDYDYLIMRYPGASLPLIEFLKHCKSKVIFEHNSIEAKEKEFYIKNFSFKDYLYLIWNGRLKVIFNEWIALRRENKYAKEVLSLAYRGLAVTSEIAEYQKQRSSNYNVRVISNGIDTKEISSRKPPKFDEKEALVMIISSGTSNTWHGLDRLLKGMYNYQGGVKLKLIVAGLYHYKYYKLINKICNHPQKEIACPGLLDSMQMREYTSQAHLGIGSLGLHRIPLMEASTLKVREYCASGLPFILSHDDVDLMHDTSFDPFYLKITPDESAVKIEDLIHFTRTVYRINNFANEMRALCYTYMDTSIKMSQLAEYLLKNEGNSKE